MCLLIVQSRLHCSSSSSSVWIPLSFFQQMTFHCWFYTSWRLSKTMTSLWRIRESPFNWMNASPLRHSETWSGYTVNHNASQCSLPPSIVSAPVRSATHVSDRLTSAARYISPLAAAASRELHAAVCLPLPFPFASLFIPALSSPLLFLTPHLHLRVIFLPAEYAGQSDTLL